MSGLGSARRSDFRWDGKRRVYICPNGKLLRTARSDASAVLRTVRRDLASALRTDPRCFRRGPAHDTCYLAEPRMKDSIAFAKPSSL
jgi:hypothetical protein